jgi:hypothetical protein
MVVDTCPCARTRASRTHNVRPRYVLASLPCCFAQSPSTTRLGTGEAHMPSVGARSAAIVPFIVGLLCEDGAAAGTVPARDVTVATLPFLYTVLLKRTAHWRGR